MNVSLRAAAVLGMNALHECIVPKGAETQISDAMRALRSAIDADLSATQPEGFQARYRIPGGEWSSWGHVVCGVKGHEQELRVAPGASRAAARAAVDAEGWISVETRLPSLGDDVLCFWPPADGRPVHSGCFGVATYSASTHWHNPEDDGDDYIKPSHWQRVAAPGPASPTPAATELELLQVECAGHESAAFHLGMLVDELRPLLSRAMAAMKTLHEAAQPDESGPDIDAIVPGADFRKFVDAHAQLLHDVAQLPEAPTPTPAAAPVVQPPASQRDELLQASLDFIGTLTGLKPPPIEVAPPEVFAPFYAFVERVQGITGRAPAVDAPHVGDVGGARDAERYRAVKARHAMALVHLVTDKGGYSSVTAPGIIDAWADAAVQEVNEWDAMTTDQRADWWQSRLDAARAAQQGAEHGSN